ncbi:hypothetical protein TCE0_041r13766 [Talaromyces pinophilus]|uniref:Uncharacterized protein n=1 Tax=Talaromyces pinophilus TaxID=128442 RepID=A0A6V8HGZ5_TALPI|nr:hypothetical protein TCE0_041r13766 [Talaromyces pinophilus]
MTDAVNVDGNSGDPPGAGDSMSDIIDFDGNGGERTDAGDSMSEIDFEGSGIDIMNADRDTVLEELPHQRVRVITDLILKHWFSCDDLHVKGIDTSFYTLSYPQPPRVARRWTDDERQVALSDLQTRADTIGIVHDTFDYRITRQEILGLLGGPQSSIIDRQVQSSPSVIRNDVGPYVRPASPGREGGLDQHSEAGSNGDSGEDGGIIESVGDGAEASPPSTRRKLTWTATPPSPRSCADYHTASYILGRIAAAVKGRTEWNLEIQSVLRKYAAANISFGLNLPDDFEDVSETYSQPATLTHNPVSIDLQNGDGEFVVQNFSDDVGHVAKVLENDGARIIISDIEAVNAAANIAAPVTTIVTTAVAVLEMQPGSSVSDFFWSDNAVNAV